MFPTGPFFLFSYILIHLCSKAQIPRKKTKCINYWSSEKYQISTMRLKKKNQAALKFFNFILLLKSWLFLRQLLRKASP